MTSRVFHAALTAGLIFSLICLLEPPARAYIDPGSGLLAYQTLSALVTGVIFYLRRRIRKAFRGLRANHGAAPPSL